MSQKKKTEGKKLDKGEKKQYIYEKLVEQQSEARVIRKIVFTSAVVLILLAAVLAGGGYYYINEALKPVDADSKKQVVVKIPIGSSVSGIGQALEEKGIIRDSRVFKYYVKFKNESGFMAGDYKMSPSMTLPEVITSLKTGKVMQEVAVQITVPEGKQLSQIAAIIAEKTDQESEEVFAKLNDKSFLKSLMEKYPDLLTEDILNKQIKYPLEGYLFPATYPFYTEDPTVEEIVSVMLDQTRKVVGQYKGQSESKDMSIHQLLTMASLIEEEATEKVDRDKIASVFYNRMDIGMPLQTDPTVLYALGEHRDRVFYKDLEVDSPYNTYKNKGLPPGPIANAGKMSIEAALVPADTDSLYFLATPDGDVLFSKTLEEHNRLKAEHITSNN